MKILAFFIFIFSINAYGELDASFFNLPARPKFKSVDPVRSKLPPRALEILGRHKVWQTAAGLMIKGQAPLLSAQKKWKFSKKDSKLFFDEITTLMAGKDCATQKPTSWMQGRIDLSQDLDSRDFLLGLPDICGNKIPSNFYVRYYSGDRFAISPVDDGFAVLFFPSDTSSPSRNADLIPANAFTAPGIAPAIEKATGLKGEKTAYLHHNLKSKMPVYLDSSFPAAYIEIFQQTIDRWNALLGTPLFEIEQTGSQLDPFDCSSARKLCLFWSGPEKLSFLGATGMTSITFDPQSGEIIGGYIGFASDANEDAANAPPMDVLSRYSSESTSLSDIAQIFSLRSLLKDFLHPQPTWQLSYVFSHEMGHFNGLAHNFYGANDSIDFHSHDSVMDYLPFSAIDSSSGDPGKFDRAVIGLIYGNEAPRSEYRFCDDSEANLDGVSPNPNCNQFDLGRADRWFMALAGTSDAGVFSPHPRFSGTLLDYLAAFLISDNPSVTASQKMETQIYLCDQKNLGEIRQYLNEKLHYTLSCK